MADALDKPRLEDIPIEGPPEDVPMTVLEHIGELRSRLIKALLGTLPAMILSWEMREQLLEFLMHPFTLAYQRLGLGDKAVLNYSNPPEMFTTYMKISIVCGFMMSSPWVFYQVWGFIAPGLYKKEKLYAIPFVLSSTVFFAGGAFFAYGALMPSMYETLLGMGGQIAGSALLVQPMMMITENLSFATQILLAFGVVFEVPVVVTFLALAGLVDWRQLLAFGRWWVVIASVISAVLTPTPDAGSMLLMLVPLVVLYYASVGLAYLFGPKSDADSDDSRKAA
ncbi:MAG TPA: twin-arginine translocase subunit TatC [Polyangiales bacterium]|nr:twin-arginine translocase subunit TatC [Polyangiales bacterium]